jgi:hypothetical protein
LPTIALAKQPFKTDTAHKRYSYIHKKEIVGRAPIVKQRNVQLKSFDAQVRRGKAVGQRFYDFDIDKVRPSVGRGCLDLAKQRGHLNYSV